MANLSIPENIKNEDLRTWIADAVELCKPDNVHFCDGSDEE